MIDRTPYRLLVLFPLVLGVLTWPAVTGLHAQTPPTPAAARFQLKIDPETPLKDLLPAVPKGKKIAAPLLGDDLTRVPEVQFQATDDVVNAEAIEHIAHQIAKINHLNDKKTDGFIEALRSERPDLTGLSFTLGDACRTKDERRRQFARAAALVRDALEPPSLTNASRSQAVPEPVSAETFWEQYHDLCAQDDRAQERIPREKCQTIASARIAALMQILMPMSEMHPGLVKYLSTLAHVEAAQALARLTIFSGDEDVRKAAIEALKVRRARDYTAILIEGLRYPWPAVAQHAAEAIAKLERRDLLPQLIDVLEQADPRAPVTREVKGKRVPVVRELVRINHHRSCLLCHAPGNTSDVPADTIRMEVPVPGQPLDDAWERCRKKKKAEIRQDIFVRIDVTYLRQDFSALLPVADANPWPEMQRFDFLVRSRELTDDEAREYREKLTKREPSEFSPYQRAALTALRELTGRDMEPTPEAWRRLLKQSAGSQRKTETP